MHVRKPLVIPTLLVIAAVFCVAAVQLAEQGTDEPIRTARDRWNRAVEKRDTAAFRSLLTDTYHLTSGSGQISGADAAVAAAGRLFAQRPDVVFEARPTRIRVVADHGLASEYGEWVERWREPSGLTELRGTYYALWRRQKDRWLLDGEVNVPEACSGSDYCKPR